MAADWFTIDIFSSRAAAEVAKSLLEQHGIAAVIRADDVGGMTPSLGFGSVKLDVPAEDLDEAREILRLA